MAIELFIDLGEVESEDFLLSLLDSDNIRGGIQPFGFGVNIDVPIHAQIRGGSTVPVEAEILSPTIAAPTNVLVAHLGQGSLYFKWEHATPEKVDRYELYFSTSLAGTYNKLERGVFNTTHGMISNMPVGRTFYFKLRAVGKNGAVSTQTQVKKGKFYQPLVTMKVRAIRGSSIPAGAIFTVPDQETGLLIAARANSLIMIQ